jgi:two-component system, cell cycle response regulator
VAAGARHAELVTATADWAAPILMIDDNPTKRFALRAVLEPLGLPIVEASSGLEGLRQLVMQDFAVILLDVRMPVMDGFETAALIRKRKQSELTPIIFITAHNKDEFEQADHYAEGAVDFMMAPVAPDELRAKVKVFAQLFAQAAQLAAQTRALQTATEEMGVLNRELAAIARRDALTGLRNRRALGEDLEMCESYVSRYGHSFCMAMLDIDHFKGYNDTFGHQTGDEILQLFAVQLTALLRDGDVLYRYGGEEFVVVLPEQSLESGGRAMERMRTGIEALGLAHPTAHGGILTFSAGLAILAAGSHRLSGDVLLEADRALYRAKALGRNRVEYNGRELGELNASAI